MSTMFVSHDEMDELFDKRMEDAAKWLDKKFPGWHNDINLETFDMEDPENCIAPNLPGYQDSYGWDRLRMDYHKATGNDCRGVFAGYTPTWVRLIQERRNNVAV